MTEAYSQKNLSTHAASVSGGSHATKTIGGRRRRSSTKKSKKSKKSKSQKRGRSMKRKGGNRR